MGREQVHPDPAWETGGEPAPPRGIVVGVDGSDHSQCALVWAAREAERRRRPLHIVTAYSVPIFAASGLDGGYATVDDSVIREGAEAILKHAMDKVAGYNIDVDASVENGDASGVLLEISETAELLVFGTRGRGGFVGRLLGSVSSALPAHAKCPTVTVPLICADRLGETTDDKHVLAERAEVGPPAGRERCGGRRRRLRAGPRRRAGGRGPGRAASPRRLRVVCAVPQYTGSLAWVPAPMDRDALFADIKIQLDAGVAWLRSHFPGPAGGDAAGGRLSRRHPRRGQPARGTRSGRHPRARRLRRNAAGFHVRRRPPPRQGAGHGGAGPRRSAACGQGQLRPDARRLLTSPGTARRRKDGPRMGHPRRPDPAQDGLVLALERPRPGHAGRGRRQGGEPGRAGARRPAGSRRLLPDHPGLPGSHGTPRHWPKCSAPLPRRHPR